MLSVLLYTPKTCFLSGLNMVLFLGIFSYNVQGQLAMNIDSLEKELQQEIPDTQRVIVLNGISYSYILNLDFQQAPSFASQALELADKIGYTKGMAYAQMNLAMIDVKNKNFEAAFEKYAYSKTIFDSYQDTLDLARYYHKYGNLFFAQQKRAEGIRYYRQAAELYTQISKTHRKESETYQLKEYIKISDAATWDRDFATGKEYGLKSLHLAEKMADTYSIANAYFMLGSAEYDQQKYAECAAYFIQSLDQFSKLSPELSRPYIQDIAWINYALGQCYSRFLSHLDEGLKYYKEAAALYKQTGRLAEFCQVENETGFDLMENERYEEALQHALAGLQTAEVLGKERFLGLSHKLLGEILFRTNNYNEAEKHLLQAQTIFTNTGDKQNLTIVLQKLGLIQIEKRNTTLAIEIFKQIESIAKDTRDTHTLTVAYTNLLILDVEFTNYLEMQKCFMQVINAEEQKGFTVHLQDHYRFAGISYLKNNQFDEAEVYFLKALTLAKQLGNARGIISASNNLREVNILQQEYATALEYASLSAHVTDSLNRSAHQELVAEIQAKYDLEKNEKELLELKTERQISQLEKDKIVAANLLNLQKLDLMSNEQEIQQFRLQQKNDSLLVQKSASERAQDQLNLLQKEGEIQKLSLRKQTLIKNYAFIALGTLGLLSILFYNNYITRQKVKLLTLRNKIAADLHDDVGSTLSSISIFSEMARQQSKEVIPMLDTIDESSRKMLDAMGDIVWTIHPENDQFEKIILRMRSFAYNLLGAKEIHFTFEADQDIAQLRLPMDIRKNLYLIFKEAANNLAKYSDANQAYFSIKREAKILEMVVRDNGKGFDTTLMTEGNGIRNMKRRAQEIGGNLSIASYPGNGTTIHLQVAI